MFHDRNNKSLPALEAFKSPFIPNNDALARTTKMNDLAYDVPRIKFSKLESKFVATLII